ncbi:MAG: formimidoylglutamate deiminase [Myxococcales bacterium]|nr:formimidoylglutamate deiminase [Myxococcales bacterium]
MLATRDGDQIVLPGLASAHSHAFQRALRGHCQRTSSSQESFWSWRGTMYALASKLGPESIYDLARFAYAELAMAGVTAVGEFHYVHHQPGSQPYGNRTELAEQMIRAAQDVGIRICLQRVLYQRAGLGKELEDGQERFCDARVEDGLADVENLLARYGDTPGVTIGVALHSVRALGLDWIREASDFAKKRGLPLHMHLSEQMRELEECNTEHGTTPVALMRDNGVLDKDFVAVHATHLCAEEVTALGDARSFVCVCRTTERDLGDGHCDARALLGAGARLCTGIDSHAICDPFEEARAIELDQRTADQGRTRVTNAGPLLAAASSEGYAALGMSESYHSDEVRLRAGDPALVGATDAHLDDAVIFGGSPRAIESVRVGSARIVENGLHRDYEEIRRRYEHTFQALFRGAEFS